MLGPLGLLICLVARTMVGKWDSLFRDIVSDLLIKNLLKGRYTEKDAPKVESPTLTDGDHDSVRPCAEANVTSGVLLQHPVRPL